MDEATHAEAIACARRVIQGNVDAVRAAGDALDEGFSAAARAIATCTGTVIVTGSGTSAAVALRAAHLFSVCGTPAFHLSPTDGLHGGLGALRPNDLVLALSKGGSSQELNEFCARAKTLAGTLVAITNAPGSDLGRMADHVIDMRLPAGTELGGVIATGSSLATAALTDALVETARVVRGYSWERVFFTHPSGAVGRDAEQSLAAIAEQGGAAR